MKENIGKTATLKKGWGYWDTTFYPYGGCFRRATDDMTVKIKTDCGNKYGYEATYDDGKRGITLITNYNAFDINKP